MRIIFMGTPDFAVASLAKLVESGANIVAVVTSMDKPSGRGLAINESAVKKYAVSKNIPVLQPEKLKSPEFLEELKSYKADFQIVVAFRMLPEIVWNMPPKGTFNLHGSLLPQYRGAAPINWAIINGEKETGVTTFFLQHEIDTGSIIFQEKTAIGPDETVGDLYERLMHMGADLVLKTVKAIEANNYPQTPQNQDIEINHAPKIFKETCEIDWAKSASAIHNFIRGLSPYPTAWTSFGGKICKIYKTHIVESEAFDITEIGNYSFDKKSLIFKTGEGFLSVDELQQEGKKRMGVEEFLRGFRG
ncbi:MAG: methionyl-tRNA formyltransferase [Bacteroidota bacterium]